jgi:hypothetical protein
MTAGEEASAAADGRLLVFVGGLHRSGTTPVTHWLGEHPSVSAFRDTGVSGDEGQHLQDVYRIAGAHGGPGRFAFDPEAHLTEFSPLVSAESRERLWASWCPHWDLSKPVLVEKSPPNLVRNLGRPRTGRHPIRYMHGHVGYRRLHLPGAQAPQDA